MKRTSILLTLLMTVSVLSAQLPLNSRRVTTTEGLAGNTINDIVQDGDGFIWMATNNGISRFDGFSTVNIADLSTDREHRMEARVGRLFIDEQRNMLWLSTATYQNACYDLGRARFTDWTGRGDHHRQQNKVMMTGRGMVLYGMGTGATIGNQDYRMKDGELPSDNVLAVVEDSAHNIWLPTDRGLAVLEGGELSVESKGVSIIAAATSGTTTYFMDSDGRVTAYDGNRQQVLTTVLPTVLARPKNVNTSFVWQGRWLLFTPEGTIAMNTADGTFEKPTALQITDGLNQGTCEGYHLIANRTGRLWLFPDSGEVKELDLIPEAYYLTNKGRKFHTARTADGRLFIATYGNGLFVYNPANNALDHYGADDAKPVIHSDYLTCAMTDRQGNVWIGSESVGAYCISAVNEDKARYIKPQPDKQSDWDNSISTIYADNSTIIIGTRRGNIYEDFEKQSSKKASINAYFKDSKGRTWIGTWGDGLYVDGQRFSTADSTHYVPSDFIAAIAEDKDGHIWIGTWNAGLLMMTNNGYRQFMNDNMNSSRISDMEMGTDGSVWVASNNGIAHISPTAQQSTPKTYLTGSEIRAILADGKESLWAACGGAGVARCHIDDNGSIGRIEMITAREGLANNSATSLVKDTQGYIWVGTEDGVSRINPEGNVVSSYRFAPTPQGNNCCNNSAIAANGRIYFGTTDGLLLVSPEAMLNETVPVISRITDVSVNGVSIHDLGLLDQAMTNTRKLRLQHDQNTLRIFFSDFDYNRNGRPVFQYYLEGMGNDWQGVTTENHADYSKLRPGHYTFHLRSLNAKGEWNEEVTLDIVIRQPWWNTWWAWLIYMMALAAMGYYIYRNWHDKFKLHQQMKMERQLAEFRTSIFTNITHEFRTPLAIIKGAVDKLAADGNNHAAQQTAQRATNRMLRMVNQFMEYRKLSTGNVRLQVESGDVVPFIRNLTDDLRPMAQQKEQTFTFTPFAKHYQMLFDQEKLEMIVYNLVSNAIKYTPERGTISVKMMQEGTVNSEEGGVNGGQLRVEVEDNGPGISDEQQAALFRPFMHGYISRGGMGIGLHTAHQMAMAHHGTLTYQRLTPQGGSRFTLTLPTAADAYAPDEISNPTAGLTDDDPKGLSNVEGTIAHEMIGRPINDITVAIIEDDPDMMQQIKTEVGTYFKVVAYSTGQAGLDAVISSPPSLLICDVMLPDISGYEIVKKLKSQDNTIRMPIIMLTSLDDENHQIRAYKAGADDYMVKPCNFRLLIARALQLIKWSAIHEVAEGNEPDKAHDSQPIIESHLDKLFLQKLQTITAQHLEDPTFSVDRLAEIMKMGRTKFYGKVKELTGMSPNKYLQEARMERAAKLLLEGELTVSEVSYKVGIQDPSYFNKMFKARYGVVPSKYGR